MTPLLVLLFGFHPATAVGTDLLYASVTKTCGTAVHHIGQTRRVAGSWLARRGQPTSEPPYTAADLAPAAQQRGGEPDFVCPRLRASVVGAKPSFSACFAADRLITRNCARERALRLLLAAVLTLVGIRLVAP